MVSQTRFFNTTMVYALILIMSMPAGLGISGAGETAAQAVADDAVGTLEAASGTPAAAAEHNITFFLHNVTGAEPSKVLPGGNATWNWFDTTTDFNEQNSTIEILGAINILDFFLWPALAAPVNTSEISLKLWMKATGSAPNAQVDMTVFEVTDLGETQVWVQNFGSPSFTLTPQLRTWTCVGNESHIFPAGSSIKIQMRINPGVNKNIYVMYDSPSADSRVVIPTADYINVDSITTEDYTNTPTNVFRTDVDNKTMYFKTEVSDPYGGYDIKDVRLTVTDPLYNTLIDNISMYKISGTPIGYISVYNHTWNYSGQMPGKYNITVWVCDNSGHTWYNHFAQYTYHYYAKEYTSSFYIGDLPRYVWLTAVDDLDVPLPGAMVRAEAAGNLVAFNVTNATGMTNISLYPQAYDLTVEWEGVQVGLLQYTVSDNVSQNQSLVINCSVFYPTLHVVDNSTLPIDNAALYITHPNGTPMPPVKSDASGDHQMYKRPGGDWDIIVRWRGIEIHTDTTAINSSGTYQLNCSVYYLTVAAVDDKSTPVSNLVVTAYDNITGFILSFKTTDASGEAEIRVPGGTVDLAAYWQNLPVNVSYGIDVNGDAYIQLNCAIYNASVTVRDSHGIPVENAQVVIRDGAGGMVLDSGQTNSQGTTWLNVIGGTFYLEVRWQGILVSAGAVAITGDPVLVDASIYYVTFTALDSRGEPVSDAVVSLYHEGDPIGSNSTDGDGSCVLRLPAGLLEVRVTWLNSLVYEGVYPVIGDGDTDLHLSIHYASVVARDSMDEPVPEATIYFRSAATGELVDTVVTDGNGTAESRLMAGKYNVEVYWHNILVGTFTNFQVTGDITGYILDLDIYHVTFSASDSRSAPVTSGSLSVTNSASGDLLGSGVTDPDGDVELRLPVSSIDISLIWDEVEVYFASGVTVGSDGVIGLDADVFYAEFTALDAAGETVEDATINLLYDGEKKYSQSTDADGEAGFRVPGADYDIRVQWQRVTVGSVSGMTIDADVDDELDLSIYHVTFQVSDSAGVAVTGASVRVDRTSTGDILSTGLTDDSGGAFAVLPGTDTDITVTWRSREVYSLTGYTIDSNHELNISVRVFYLAFVLSDSKGGPLGEAQLTASSPLTGEVLDSGSAAGDGTLVLRLPAGPAGLEARWAGHLVYNGSLDVTADVGAQDPMILSCRVYHLTFSAMDSHDAPLEDALVTVTTVDGETLMASVTADAAGEGSVRLPTGDFALGVEWMGSPVYGDPQVAISTDVDPFTLECDVYYLDMTALDDMDAPVADAYIDITGGDGLPDAVGMTGLAGDFGVRLPAGAYDIYVEWAGMPVAGEDGLDLSADISLTLDCSVYYLNVSATDDRSAALEGAWVSVSMVGGGDVSESEKTGSGGLAGFRLPGGAYAITIGWMGVTVYTDGDHDLNGTHALDASCAVHYLAVTAVDSASDPVKGLTVTVTGSGNGIVAHQETDGDGVCEFRLPAGTYAVTARLQDTVSYQEIDEEQSQDVQLTSSQDVELKYSDYPPEYTSTPQFRATMTSVSLLLVILVMLALFLLSRRRKKAKVTGEEAGDADGDGDGDGDDTENVGTGAKAGDEGAGAGPKRPAPAPADLVKKSLPDDDIDGPDEGGGKDK